jgi:hypothetical protein
MLARDGDPAQDLSLRKRSAADLVSQPGVAADRLHKTGSHIGELVSAHSMKLTGGTRYVNAIAMVGGATGDKPAKGISVEIFMLIPRHGYPGPDTISYRIQLWHFEILTSILGINPD